VPPPDARCLATLTAAAIESATTSGTFSPTLQEAIAMAYVDPGAAEVGTAVEVDVRGKRVAAEVVKLPFYRREA